MGSRSLNFNGKFSLKKLIPPVLLIFGKSFTPPNECQGAEATCKCPRSPRRWVGCRDGRKQASSGPMTPGKSEKEISQAQVSPAPQPLSLGGGAARD